MQNWNKFNESYDDEAKKKIRVQKSDEFKNMLDILKSDNGISIT